MRLLLFTERSSRRLAESPIASSPAPTAGELAVRRTNGDEGGGLVGGGALDSKHVLTSYTRPRFYRFSRPYFLNIFDKIRSIKTSNCQMMWMAMLKSCGVFLDAIHETNKLDYVCQQLRFV